MEVTDIITPERTFTDVEGTSKKRVLENAAGLIAQQAPEFTANELFDNLITRERLGSTAIGKGVAIPHCRAKHCSHTIGALFKLQEPVDFDAQDDEPVDLMFVLLVPEEATEEHLQLLSQIAQRFSDENVRDSLREARDKNAFFEEFVKNPSH
ncbi:MAG: PTS IIA-like nitrogen regulatory protein PtsN [Ketobacteraceae bacterium]|nr:PTS IIA-like nitrogen regulatory protein PtsN [Ketobacteraceae bacterium]